MFPRRNSGGNQAELRNNIIVRYLPLDLDEDGLHAIFSSVGPIKSVKVMCVSTGSEGYGFVNFHNREDAERAIEIFNGYRITDRKTLKVSWSVPGKRVGCKVFVTNLPPHWTKIDFEHAFQTQGIAEEVRLVGMRNGRSSAFILYFNPMHAQQAIMRMNGKMVEGGIAPLRVELARRSADKIRPHPALMHHQTFPSTRPSPYMGSMPRSMWNHPRSIESRGLYLRDDSYEEMDKRSAKHVTDDAGPSTTTTNSVQLFFFNMSREMQPDFIRSLFGNYGDIKKLKLDFDNDGMFLGMGLLTFESSAAVGKVYAGLHNTELHGRKLQIKCDF